MTTDDHERSLQLQAWGSMVSVTKNAESFNETVGLWESGAMGAETFAIALQRYTAIFEDNLGDLVLLRKGLNRLNVNMNQAEESS